MVCRRPLGESGLCVTLTAVGGSTRDIGDVARASAPLAVIRGHEHPEHALRQCSFLLLIINVPLLIFSRALFFGPALPSLGGSRARSPFIRVTPNFRVPSAGSGVSWLTPQPTRELRRTASCDRRDSWRAIEGNRPKGPTIANLAPIRFQIFNRGPPWRCPASPVEAC